MKNDQFAYRARRTKNHKGVCIENINLTVEESYTDDDLRYLRKIFQNPYLTKSDIVQAYENNDIVRIADKRDYEYAYEDFANKKELHRKRTKYRLL